MNTIMSNPKYEHLWTEVSTRSNNFELSLDGDYRRNTGSYYTGFELAVEMVNDLFMCFPKQDFDYISQLRLLEPCVGSGNFIFAYLKKLYELNFTSTDIQNILSKIYVCDINEHALSLYKELLTKVVEELWNFDINQEYFSTNVVGGLLFDLTSDNPEYVELSSRLSTEVIKDGFDIIITNPPYKNLKAEKNKFSDANLYLNEKQKYEQISKHTKKHFKYSNEGVLNLYKLFVEKIITEYSNQNAFISLLVPATILSDKTCEKLRTNILNTTKIFDIKLIKENNAYINAQQSLCTLTLKKNEPTTVISMTPDYCTEPKNVTTLNIDDILNPITGNSIFSLPSHEYKVLRKMRVFPNIKELDFIVNMRGELDLTSNVNHITADETPYPLLRGKNVGYFNLSQNPVDYVTETFVENSSKSTYISNDRIICQQVVNIHKERRITFSYIQKNYVLGNSCNFISVKPNKYNIDLFCILGLLNSPIINWFFKITSSNNHVNNYEIDAFPIPVGSEDLLKIGILTKEYLKTNKESLLEEIYSLSYSCYGVSEWNNDINENSTENDNVPNYQAETTSNHETSKSKDLMNIEIDTIVTNLYHDLIHIIPTFSLEDAKSIIYNGVSFDTIILQKELTLDTMNNKVCKHIIDKHLKKRRNEIYNHTTFKLSDLDLEMVRAVPQGGNWKNIPMETIEKSKRLLRINETGGRTTLYGRIDYTKPAYTVTTYFNRPGNGTYIHPIHDRVISVREAARLQSFKDDYYFFGNKTELLKQVGNAVPPKLAYQIGKSIINKTNFVNSLDLFCGAGGITHGFKEAGIRSKIGLDFEKSACITIKANNPEIDIICDDITDPSVKESIIEKAIKSNVEIVCGGPPCQGFSHAGKRFIDDPRNELFKHFIDVVAGVNPKIVVMENVEGMLTFQNGEIYRQIIELFTSIGYKTEGRMLYAHKYGVPQKRKRVIIICVKNDLEIEPFELFPKELTPNEGDFITAKDAISDLENIDCSENATYSATIKLSEYTSEMIGINKFPFIINDSTEVSVQDTIEFEQLTLFA